jgi:hypothetical protein
VDHARASLRVLPAAFVALLAVGGADAQTPSGALTIDALLDIRHPSKAAWSPDGQRIAFAWERSGAEDVYIVDAKAREPRALTHHETGLVGGLTWRRDGAAVYFERAGDLWEVASSGAQLELSDDAMSSSVLWRAASALIMGVPSALLVGDVAPRSPVDVATRKGHVLEWPLLGKPLANGGIQPGL